MPAFPLKDKVAPIVWRGDRLRVLDQRLLPRRVSYIDCRTAQDVARATAEMALRGAPLIGCAAAYGMALAARRGRRELPEAAAALKAARPTAVNLAHAVDHMLAAARQADGSLARELERQARDYYQADLRANQTMARLGAALLRKKTRVITYCNAGALATSGLGTSLGVIRYAHHLGKVEHVYACETRPYLQGSRLTLWELMNGGVPCTLITDNMAAHMMKLGGIGAIFVGADRIAANADVCNKIGTYGLAILAKYHRIPFYVVAPTSTIDPATPVGDAIPIEERSAAEIVRIQGREIAPKGAAARHFAFDVTPRSLVTAIVTERGIIRPAGARALRRVLS
ncbi:MAG: S-methyl-5-thioribose-1-phosphate isomerase [Elusimicrobia bacterium]|nr:S-methyl-5-thioribose-1-phosphate isomerase [Elusimicrobiota bacterium]MDE2424509.1 S-methyl-5-thioribose-1-phosphate isomerase [Elusimicrobiota bacterium]